MTCAKKKDRLATVSRFKPLFLSPPPGCGHARRVGWGVGPRLSHVVIENNEAGSGLRWQPAVRLRHGRAARRRRGGSSLAPSTRSSSAADAVCTASAWFVGERADVVAQVQLGVAALLKWFCE
jgi:hypothetical protein